MAKAILLLSLAAFVVSISAKAGFDSDLASVVDSTIPPHVDWDYSDGPLGPAHWGELTREWSACSKGSKQSPINVVEDLIQLDGTLDVPNRVYYGSAPAYVYGDGKILEAKWAAGIYNVHDYDYVLEKVVFHTPSEHTYFGKRFDLEVQFYHTHPTEGVATNVIVFEEGEENLWLEQFMPAISNLGKLGQTISAGVVDGTEVMEGAVDWTRYYRYLGSLPTPPCTERPSVVYSLLKSPLTASKEQIAKVAAALLNKPNTRPVQPYSSHIYYPRYVDA